MNAPTNGRSPAASSFSVPCQRNELGASVLYALKPYGLDTAFVESLTSYLRRLGLSHAQRPSFLIQQMIGKPYRTTTGQKFHASLTITEAVNGRTQMTPILLAYLESLTWVADVRRTAFGDRIPGIYLARSACVVRQWCPECLREDGNHPYDRLAWSLTSYAACVVHDRAMASICGTCNQPHLPFKAGAEPDRCPCGARLSETQTLPLPATARERGLIDLVMRLERGQPVTMAQVHGGVQAMVRRHGGVTRATAGMGCSPATLGNLLARRTSIGLESLLRTLEGAEETLDEFLAHPDQPWTVRIVPQRVKRRNGRPQISVLHLESALRAELARPDSEIRPLGRFADDHGTRWKPICDQLPDLAKELVERGKAIRHQRRLARDAARIAEVCDAVRAYHAKHGTVSFYAVSKELPRPGVMRSREVYKAAVKVRDELLAQAKANGEKEEAA